MKMINGKLMDLLEVPGSGYQAFTDLEVWQQARRIKLLVRELVKIFPVSERFLLSGQITRSARYVTSNIAAGHGRRYPKDELHFCIQARGSLSETLNQVIDALDEGYITEAQFNNLKKRISYCGAIAQRLY